MQQVEKIELINGDWFGIYYAAQRKPPPKLYSYDNILSRNYLSDLSLNYFKERNYLRDEFSWFFRTFAKLAKLNPREKSTGSQLAKLNLREKISFFIFPRKFYIRRNNNKIDSIETGRIVIAHLLPWSDLEKRIYNTFF